MEKNNYLTLGLTALGGVVVGVALMGLIWYENPCTETGTKFLPEEIPDVPTANKYFHNFYDAATTDKIKGIKMKRLYYAGKPTKKYKRILNQYKKTDSIAGINFD